MYLTLNNLKKSFGEKTAVNIPSFTVNSGDILGLVGNNGAGKTTLSGKLAAKYSYDAWGKCVSVENADGYTIGTANPFRYRGYYYDNEQAEYSRSAKLHMYNG